MVSGAAPSRQQRLQTASHHYFPSLPRPVQGSALPPCWMRRECVKRAADLQRYTISPLSLSPTPPPLSHTHHARTHSYMHARTHTTDLDCSASWHKLQVLYESWVWGHIYYSHIRAQEHQAQEPIYKTYIVVWGHICSSMRMCGHLYRPEDMRPPMGASVTVACTHGSRIDSHCLLLFVTMRGAPSGSFVFRGLYQYIHQSPVYSVLLASRFSVLLPTDHKKKITKTNQKANRPHHF